MINQSKLTRLAVKMAATAFTLFALTQCTEQEDIKPAAPAVEETANVTPATGQEPALSLTIDGIHTVLSSTTDCKSCTYIVPENATVVDGKELGIKPGQAICLKENGLYGNLKLINLEGKADEPIIIAYGVKTINTAEDQTATN
ncbi:MAG TPA: hypothetical protein VD884_01775 [Ohtaekwangia sp.]|nr:hypothetical protein [Ohtaekwangia sp.]